MISINANKQSTQTYTILFPQNIPKSDNSLTTNTINTPKVYSYKYPLYPYITF